MALAAPTLARLAAAISWVDRSSRKRNRRTGPRAMRLCVGDHEPRRIRRLDDASGLTGPPVTAKTIGMA